MKLTQRYSFCYSRVFLLRYVGQNKAEILSKVKNLSKFYVVKFYKQKFIFAHFCNSLLVDLDILKLL